MGIRVIDNGVWFSCKCLWISPIKYLDKHTNYANSYFVSSDRHTDGSRRQFKVIYIRGRVLHYGHFYNLPLYYKHIYLDFADIRLNEN